MRLVNKQNSGFIEILASFFLVAVKQGILFLYFLTHITIELIKLCVLFKSLPLQCHIIPRLSLVAVN